MSRSREEEFEWFIEADWVNRVISFEAAQDYSTHDWKITSKLSEHNNQSNAFIYQRDPRPTEAWGVFKCVNNANTQSAIMKIYKQIPYDGSLPTTPDFRRVQASANLARYSRRELPALTTLTKAKCKSTPILINCRQAQQNDLPDGYILYLVMCRLPGIRLSYDLYWQDMSRGERDAIRQAFKQSWHDCLRAGIVNLDEDPDNLLWDESQKKIYILGHSGSRMRTAADTWDNSIWWQWSLSKSETQLDISDDDDDDE